MGPMMPFQANRTPFQRQRGGILSRLFRRNNMPVQQPINPFQFQGARQGLNTQSGGSILQNMLNPESLSRFLNQTQQVLKTVQSHWTYGTTIRSTDQKFAGFMEIVS